MWTAPAAVPGLPAPAEYQVYLYSGTVPSTATLVPPVNPQIVTGTALDLVVPSNSVFTVHVVASGPNGTDVAPNVFASVTFTS